MTAEEITKFTRKRASLKAQITSFSKFLETLSFPSATEQEQKQVLEPQTVISIEERLAKIEDTFSKFDEVQTNLETIVDESQLDEQLAQRVEFEKSYFKLVSKAKSILQIQTSNMSDTPAMSEASNASQRPSGGATLANFGIKLPDIPLPKFQGNYDAWLEYRDSFRSLIDENDSLTSMQKYHYLRASLDGTASQVIKALDFVAESYSLAWRTLCERYDNNKLLIHNHVKALFSFEPIQKESCFKIRKLLDDLSKHLRSLSQLGEKTENWDTLLIFMIASKLDNQTLREWERHTAFMTHSPRLTELKEFLKNRANLLETLDFKNNEKTSDKSAKLRDSKLTSKSLLASNTNTTSSNTNHACPFCKSSHLLYICDDFAKLDVKQRQNFVGKSKLCPNCLRSGHPVTRCRLGPCKKCKG